MNNLAFWRDVSLILLVLEAFVLCLPVLIIGVFIVRGLGALRRWLRGQFPTWQAYVFLGHDTVDRYAQVAITPVLAIAAAGSMVASAIRTVSRLTRAQGRTRYQSGGLYGEQYR